MTRPRRTRAVIAVFGSDDAGFVPLAKEIGFVIVSQGQSRCFPALDGYEACIAEYEKWLSAAAS